ncbi:MAG: hypothetical protein ACRYHQ_10925 [Janthinobacterium lividum]
MPTVRGDPAARTQAGPRPDAERPTELDTTMASLCDVMKSGRPTTLLAAFLCFNVCFAGAAGTARLGIAA